MGPSHTYTLPYNQVQRPMSSTSVPNVMPPSGAFTSGAPPGSGNRLRTHNYASQRSRPQTVSPQVLALGQTPSTNQASHKPPMANAKTGFRYVASFKTKPVSLKATPAVQQFTFHVTQHEYDNRASPRIGPPKPNSIAFRLHGTACSASEVLEESSLVVKEPSYPQHVYYTLNAKRLVYPRQDSHHKYSTIDVTDLVVAGVNTLQLSINRRSDANQDLNHAIAIECVLFRDYEQVRADCLSRPAMTRAEVLDSIKQALTPTSSDDADDLMLVDANVTITVTEPFSASKIFSVPVRGIRCTHWQPFDLDVFLETRAKSSNLAGYTKVDAWRCPICGRDARPTSLVKDEFMVEVRAELARRGMLDTRAIVVEKDGSWKPKVDEKNPEKDRQSAASKDDEKTIAKVIEREIIELD